MLTGKINELMNAETKEKMEEILDEACCSYDVTKVAFDYMASSMTCPEEQAEKLKEAMLGVKLIDCFIFPVIEENNYGDDEVEDLTKKIVRSYNKLFDKESVSFEFVNLLRIMEKNEVDNVKFKNSMHDPHDDRRRILLDKIRMASFDIDIDDLNQENEMIL